MKVRVAVFPVLVAALVLGTRTIDAFSENTCQVEKLYTSSLPAGGADTPHIQILGDQLSADRCLAKCCSLGPEACQYLWIIDTTCIAVACDSDKISNCEPKSVPISIRKGSSSVYVALKHSTPSANELENALDLMSRFSSDGSKGKEDVLGDSPPIAATLTDEIVITLPTNEVNIFGNHSKDDKGIAAYSWKLLSEHFVQPLLENADQAILHAGNLLPGNYQFSLTVTDTSGQSSRTTVLVRVNKGSTFTEVSTTTGSLAMTTVPMDNNNRPLTTTLITPTNEMDLNDTADIEDEEFDFYTKRRNTLKIVVPSLVSLAVLLVATAAITTACACCCQRNKDRMRRYYKYKKLPETIQQT
ncbi:uncharacterized protein LOC135339305 isoform X2 [Halichondria panicea]|uniref:uncharacterized protein LOC135339305 isoform X2 n=1 Tax=Halichondria panicea TaxID=6063 RepID=UPI00312B6092